MAEVKMSNQPIKLVCNRIFRGYPGGRETDRFRGVENPQDDKRPESWVGSTTYTFHHSTDPDSKLGLAEMYCNDGTTMYLKDVLSQDPIGYLGEKHVSKYGDDIAVLVKLLDAQRQLGLQAHPDRDFAKRMFHSDYGKAESWYVIGVREDQDEVPYVLLGFKEGITREKFQELFFQGDIRAMENWCHKIPVSVGEMYFVDAGVPHAIGPGCFVIEVQEPSDITVGARMREFDDPEEQENFVERTMGCYHYIGRSYDANLDTYRIQPRVLVKTSDGTEALLLGKDQTAFFSVTRLDVVGELKDEDRGVFSIVIILDGEGTLLYEGGQMNVKKGEEIFLPAGTKNLTWKAANDKLSAVRCYPPDVL